MYSEPNKLRILSKFRYWKKYFYLHFLFFFDVHVEMYSFSYQQQAFVIIGIPPYVAR